MVETQRQSPATCRRLYSIYLTYLPGWYPSVDRPSLIAQPFMFNVSHITNNIDDDVTERLRLLGDTIARNAVIDRVQHWRGRTPSESLVR